ncbi:MAG: UDP-N-acetylglucosamine--LPS N-acetylglucosamine transferase [Myxococcota bacterium]
MKVGLVASSGGHLSQLRALAPWFNDHERAWVTFDTPHARRSLVGESVTFAHHPTNRSLVNLVRNFAVARRWVRMERPDLVVSTGAGVGVPFLWVARSAGIKTVFMEVYDRVDARSLTGRLVGPIVDVVVLQREAQRRLYPRGVVLGAAQ